MLKPRHAVAPAVILAAAVTAGAAPGDKTWVPTWADEFDAEAGTTPDESKWTMETGGWGWGNNELQTYTDRAENAAHDGEGHMVITAKRESFTGADGIARDYTSARLKTQGKFSQTYGRFEARLAVPSGQGIWPAFWMLGEDIATEGWPRSGEIDIMEHVGHQPGRAYGTLHGPGYSGAGGISKSYDLEDGAVFTGEFHTFAVDWTKNRIEWSIDGNVYHTLTPDDLNGEQWVFDDDFFLLLNLAVGGNWPGNPDASTTFPQTYKIDYVRAFEQGVETRDDVDNGAFLDGATDWTLSGNAYVEAHDPAATPSRIAADGAGDSALKLFGTFADGDPTRAVQAFLTPNFDEDLIFSATVRTNSDDAIVNSENSLVMLVEFYDVNDTLVHTERRTVLDGDASADEWLDVSMAVSSPSGSAYATIGFEFLQPHAEGGAVWIDDVTFGVAAVPEPRIAGLAGTAMMGLLAHRR